MTGDGRHCTDSFQCLLNYQFLVQINIFVLLSPSGSSSDIFELKEILLIAGRLINFVNVECVGNACKI